MNTLNIETVLTGHVSSDLFRASDVGGLLLDNGYTDQGWLNSGVIPKPANDYITGYKNRSGSTTLMLSKELKMFYWVDMGD